MASPTSCTFTTVSSLFCPRPRRIIAFNFLGWGASAKPQGYPVTAANQLGELDSVIQQLALGQVVLVAHALLRSIGPLPGRGGLRALSFWIPIIAGCRLFALRRKVAGLILSMPRMEEGTPQDAAHRERRG